MNTEIEILVKIVAGIFSIFGLTKLVFEMSIEKKSDLRKDFEFSLHFFKEYENNMELSQIVIEKGLRAVAGTRMLSASEIKYLLTLKCPSKNIYRYELSQDYLEYDEHKSEIKISYSKQCKSKARRTIMKAAYLGLYAIAFLLVQFPAMFFSSIQKFGNIFTLLLLAAFFLYIAWTYLKKYVSLRMAEVFISEQEIDEKQKYNEETTKTKVV